MSPTPATIGPSHALALTSMDAGTECKISMLWNWYTVDTCLLSSSWHITSPAMFAGSCLAVIMLVMGLFLLRRVHRQYDAFIARAPRGGARAARNVAWPSSPFRDSYDAAYAAKSMSSAVREVGTRCKCSGSADCGCKGDMAACKCGMGGDCGCKGVGRASKHCSCSSSAGCNCGSENSACTCTQGFGCGCNGLKGADKNCLCSATAVCSCGSDGDGSTCACTQGVGCGCNGSGASSEACQCSTSADGQDCGCSGDTAAAACKCTKGHGGKDATTKCSCGSSANDAGCGCNGEAAACSCSSGAAGGGCGCSGGSGGMKKAACRCAPGSGCGCNGVMGHCRCSTTHGCGCSGMASSCARRPSALQQAIRASLHALQFGLAYIIMLLAMSFNGYIFICIFFGAFLGYFAFEWAPMQSVDQNKQQADVESSGCCA